MFRERNIEHFLYKNKKRKHGYGGYTDCKITPGQWLTIELNVMKKFVQISRDGKVIGTGKYNGLIPLESISFRLYNTIAEIDDFSMTLQKETKIETEKKPVVQLDFNNGLDGIDGKGGAIKPLSASSYRLTPGIDGKALTIDPGKAELLLTYRTR